MTPDELAQELADLDRLAPPPIDSAALLRLQARIAELEAEKAELTRTVAQQSAHLRRQTELLESRKRELAALVSESERKQNEWESRSANWHRREAFWALDSQRERADQRAQRLQKTRWLSLGLGTAVLGLGFIWAAERYWTFTQDQQFQMMQAAAKDKAVLVQQARQEYEKAARLTRRAQRSSGTPNRTTNAGAQNAPGESRLGTGRN